jgi:fucose 4-O-acetylase-like acetyltransferase
LLTNGEFARYHSLDAFRAAMMLLGLVLHSAASYTYTPLRDAWPFHDPPGLVAFEILLFFIHLFRMPAFFVVAGFFAALLYYRDGGSGLIRNRARRVALPLVIFMLTALPLAGAGFLVAARLEGQPLPELLPQGPLVRQQIFGHLWFLYDLLIFYAASLVVVRVVAMLPARARMSASTAFHRYAVTGVGALFLGLITTLTLIPMTGPWLETSAALLPPLRILVAYGVFFAFGWCLYLQRHDLIPAFGRVWGRFLSAGLVLFAGYFVIVFAKRRFPPLAWHYTAIAFAGSATWCLIFGLLGLFVRRLSSPRAVVRYLSDASYWMYLTHLTAITWTAAALARVDTHPVVKFSIVLAMTTFVTLATYHWWVRSSWLGVLLNGRRRERVGGGGSRVTAQG